MGAFFHYFTDAVLRGPTIGCMLMCLSSALVGVIVYLRKQSLIGESLSHCAYPGVILGVMVAAMLGIEETSESDIAALIMLGAAFSAVLGLACIYFMIHVLKVRTDSALCFILSSFFGIGLTMASHVQFSHTSLYRKIQVYLFGQAATMTDKHIFIYGSLAALIILTLLAFYKELQAITFDRNYAKSLSLPTKLVDGLVFLLIVLAVVIGIRSVGVVLMSAMLIAPAVAARQYTHKLSVLFILAAFFGLCSGFFGNYLSNEGTLLFSQKYSRLSFPTGPMIVLVASFLCLVSLLLAPERGLLFRLWRKWRFQTTCISENLLKSLWRFGKEVDLEQLRLYQNASPLTLRLILYRLAKKGWVIKTNHNTYFLTPSGEKWAERIVRLHRLWEVYLVDYLKVDVERVHRSAEEMEHIITKDLERELAFLLKDPKKDPHQQPIPPE